MKKRKKQMLAESIEKVKEMILIVKNLEAQANEEAQVIRKILEIVNNSQRKQ